MGIGIGYVLKCCVRKKIGKCSGDRGWFLHLSSCLEWRRVLWHKPFTMVYYQTLAMWNWNIWSLVLDQGDLKRVGDTHTILYLCFFNFNLFPNNSLSLFGIITCHILLLCFTVLGLCSDTVKSRKAFAHETFNTGCTQPCFYYC